MKQIEKIDFKENVGLTVSYKDDNYNGTSVPASGTQTIYADPSAEFNSAMKRMKEALIKTTAIGMFEHLIEQDADTIRKQLKKVASKVSVTGCTIKYEDNDIAGVKIRGKYTNKVGDVLAIASPMIALGGAEEWGWEAILSGHVTDLVERTGEFLEGAFEKRELIEG